MSVCMFMAIYQHFGSLLFVKFRICELDDRQYVPHVRRVYYIRVVTVFCPRKQAITQTRRLFIFGMVYFVWTLLDILPLVGIVERKSYVY